MAPETALKPVALSIGTLAVSMGMVPNSLLRLHIIMLAALLHTHAGRYGGPPFGPISLNCGVQVIMPVHPRVFVHGLDGYWHRWFIHIVTRYSIVATPSDRYR